MTSAAQESSDSSLVIEHVWVIEDDIGFTAPLNELVEAYSDSHLTLTLTHPNPNSNPNPNLNPNKVLRQPRRPRH